MRQEGAATTARVGQESLPKILTESAHRQAARRQAGPRAPEEGGHQMPLRSALSTVVLVVLALWAPAVAGPAGGRVRVSLNGFFVNHETNDDPLERDGVRDEVFLVPTV